MSWSNWATTRYLSKAITTPAFPFSVAILAKATTISARHVAVDLYGSAANYYKLGMRNNLGATVSYIATRGTGLTEVTGATTLSTDVWYSLVGIWYAADDWRIYLDGTQDGASVVSTSPSGVNTLYIGTETTANAFIGELAEFGFWSAALSAASLADLAARKSPIDVQRKDLTMYSSLKGGWHGLYDHVERVPLVATGAITQGTHPEMNYPDWFDL